MILRKFYRDLDKLNIPPDHQINVKFGQYVHQTIVNQPCKFQLIQLVEFRETLISPMEPILFPDIFGAYDINFLVFGRTISKIL